MASGLLQDLRLALRALVATRLLTTVAIVTLAVAIGANTAVFSVVNSVLLRALPVSAPDQLMWISSDFANDRGFKSGAGWNHEMWEAFRQRSAFVAGALAWQSQRFTMGDAAGGTALSGIYASGGFFRTLGVGAALGRVLTDDDDQLGRAPVGIISHALWRRRFGGVPDIVGQALLVNNVPVTIVGVTAASFRGLEIGKPFDLAIPLSAEPAIAGPNAALFKPRSFMLLVMLRLKERQSASAAIGELRNLQTQIVPAGAPAFVKEPFTLTPAAGGASTPASSRQIYRQPLVVLLAGVGLVLVIACVNVANLLLARASERRRELAMRVALGAPKWRLARPLLLESLLLVAAGGTLGLLWAGWGAHAIVSLASVTVDPTLDLRVLGFVAAIAFATVLFCGLMPARRATRVDPLESLSGGRGAPGQHRGRLLEGLVVAQVALALVVVLAGSLLARSLASLSAQPLGFEPDRVLVVSVNSARVAGRIVDRPALHERILAAASAAPGVERSAVSVWTPLSGAGATVDMRAAGESPDAPAITVLKNMVSPGWLGVYGTPIKIGRDFTAGDAVTGPAVAIVNEAFARRFVPGTAVVGQTTPDKRLIIGLAADAVSRSSQRLPGVASLALREPVPPTIYVPLAQSPIGDRPDAESIRLSVRSAAGGAATLAPGIAAALTAVEPQLLLEFRPLADVVREALAQERMTAALGVSFGTVALLLAALGLYGVTFHAAARRRPEMGLRIALGATRRNVVGAMLRRSATLIAAGILLGLGTAWPTTHWLTTLLFGVTPMDPLTVGAVTLLLGSVGAAAAFVPAFRVSRVDPWTALRGE